MDNLITSKINQAHHTNTHCSPEIEYKVGDKVMLSTANWQREYVQKKNGRVAKFMPRQDGPFVVLEAFPESSEYVLDLLPSMRILNRFHSSLLLPYHPNNDELFLFCQLEMPGPIVTEEGQEEHFIKKILDERKWGRDVQYLVCWRGYGPNHNKWKSRKEMEDTVALDKWEALKVSVGRD